MKNLLRIVDSQRASTYGENQMKSSRNKRRRIPELIDSMDMVKKVNEIELKSPKKRKRSHRKRDSKCQDHHESDNVRKYY
jgi:hypothetical protein